MVEARGGIGTTDEEQARKGRAPAVEDIATTTEEASTVEDIATITEEASTVEDIATTTEDASTVEDIATTPEEISSVEDTATTDQPREVLEQRASAEGAQKASARAEENQSDGGQCKAHGCEGASTHRFSEKASVRRRRRLRPAQPASDRDF